MPWSDVQLKERQPVWDALSEFWLDTDLGELEFNSIARELNASPYSQEQLWRICIYEVAPVVSSNILSIAGEWSGFDPEWLREAIIKKSPDVDNYLTPSLWRRFRGLMHGRWLKLSGWNKIAKQL